MGEFDMVSSITEWLVRLRSCIVEWFSEYCLSVPVFYFWPLLTHPTARSLCDSWATCCQPLLYFIIVAFTVLYWIFTVLHSQLPSCLWVSLRTHTHTLFSDNLGWDPVNLLVTSDLFCLSELRMTPRCWNNFLKRCYLLIVTFFTLQARSESTVLSLVSSLKTCWIA